MEIWFWTDQNWSERQADTYLDGLRNEFAALADDERRGSRSDDVREGYWRKRFQSHVIFFVRTPDGIEVVRVLHRGMNFLRHLKDDE